MYSCFVELNIIDKHAILMIDEMYLGRGIELSGGDIMGFTDQGEVARTALCFMIRSIRSKHRDVISIYPLDTLKAETLEKCYN